LADRLLEGDEDIYALLDVGEAQSSSESSGERTAVPAVPAVQLVQLDAAEAMQKLIRSLCSV
jgi:hypothetical protein